jgi:BirA family transcriptional regulator, biotin operon repressor / biotin---[acetyl-CoA-carboxylase] ligase
VAPRFLSRQEHFAVVGSTNDVVRGWLAEGTPEVCLAVADRQTAGRGRNGRPWLAPAGSALLASLGFRPAWLRPERVWRLAATVSLAMADAAEEVAGLPDRVIALKWPNDLYVGMSGWNADTRRSEGEGDAPASHSPEGPRKLGGVLGETDGLGGRDPRAVIGIGVNADWPADAFPPELAATMTSLREAAHGRPIDVAHLLDAFLSRLEVRIDALRSGRFDVADWTDRQLTTGREVELEQPDGRRRRHLALAVDADSGGLVVEDPGAATGERILHVGEVRRVRLAHGAQVGV